MREMMSAAAGYIANEGLPEQHTACLQARR